jgi:hypothetical protein
MLEAYAVPGHIYSHLAPAAGLGLSCAALFIIFHRFFSVSMVTRAMLAEAFVCYLIIAIAFSQLYLLLSRVVDPPFNEQIPVTPKQHVSLLQHGHPERCGHRRHRSYQPLHPVDHRYREHDWDFLSGGRRVTPGVILAPEKQAAASSTRGPADRMTACAFRPCILSMQVLAFRENEPYPHPVS